MDDIYEEYDRPTVRERIAGFAWRALPYALFTFFLAVAVGLACRIAARVENRAASDQWSCVIESARRAVKNSGARQ